MGVKRGNSSLRLRSSAGRDGVREARCLPRVEAADQVCDVAKAGAPQDADGDRAPVASFAVHHQKLPAIELRAPRFQLSERDAQRFFDRSTRQLAELTYVQHGDPVRLVAPQLGQILN